MRGESTITDLGNLTSNGFLQNIGFNGLTGCLFQSLDKAGSRISIGAGILTKCICSMSINAMCEQETAYTWFQIQTAAQRSAIIHVCRVGGSHLVSLGLNWSCMDSLGLT